MAEAFVPLETTSDETDGDLLYGWLADLFPICRSITGDGVRETMSYIKNILPELNVCEVPSGTRAFDWTVPNEWNIRDGFLETEQGDRVVDFKNNNLHVVGYSEPVDIKLPVEEMRAHLYTHHTHREAIPYITSYYRRHWGFCMSQTQYDTLQDGIYRAVIDSTLEPGSLTYADLVLPGESDEEVLISTYTCHPSMANDNTSGIVATLGLARWLSGLSRRRFTYRFVFLPETIGSIVYLSRHIDHMKAKTVAGFVLTCISDNRSYSFLPTRFGNTLADRAARQALGNIAPDYIEYPFLNRGSDERQYCAPGVDLPVASIMRTMYAEYPEYHSSLDDLDLASPDGLMGGYEAIRSSIVAIENNVRLKPVMLCEPQLGKRGLYPDLSAAENHALIHDMMNLWSFCDGDHDLLAIAEAIKVPLPRVVEIGKRFVDAGVLEVV